MSGLRDAMAEAINAKLDSLEALDSSRERGSSGERSMCYLRERRF